VATTVGAVLALYAYQRVTDPAPALERQREVAVVMQARQLLRDYVAVSPELEIVDPLAKNRVAGKVYIYPTDDGWQVSGHYRRPPEAHWHPWLMTLDEQHGLSSLKVGDSDPRVQARAREDRRFHADKRP
jgi:hypothetical protein